MPDSLLSPKTASQWRKHLESLLDFFQGHTEGGGPTAVALQRFFGYPEAEELRKLDKTEGNGQCVALIMKYVSEIGPTTGWQPGPRVKEMKAGAIPKGSVIATFWNGVYPNNNSGQHAAFYLGHDATGIKVAEQWYGTSPKQAVKVRGGTGVIRFTGITLPDDQSGDPPKMSNIGEYYYLVLDKR